MFTHQGRILANAKAVFLFAKKQTNKQTNKQKIRLKAQKLPGHKHENMPPVSVT